MSGPDSNESTLPEEHVDSNKSTLPRECVIRVDNTPSKRTKTDLPSITAGVSVAFKLLKYTLILVIVAALVIGAVYILKILKFFDPSPDDYNKVVEKYNQLTAQYNRAVRRSYMVYIKIGKEVDGFPLRVKLVTTDNQQAVELSPTFDGLSSDDEVYKEQLNSQNVALMCYKEDTTGEICTRQNVIRKEAPQNRDECYTKNCTSGPICTVCVPYITDKGSLAWSKKRALGLNVFVNKYGAMQIQQILMRFVDEKDNKLNPVLEESEGMYPEESWSVFGKIWDFTNYDMKATPPDLKRETEEALKQSNVVYMYPSDIVENSYYKLWVNATGAIRLEKSKLLEYTQAVTDTPLNPIIGPQEPVSDLENWKTVL